MDETREIDGLVLTMRKQYWDKIVEGEKDIEVRKTIPTKMQALIQREGFARCYVYVGGEVQRVVGFFDCDRVYWSDKPGQIQQIGKTGMTAKELAKYGTGRGGRLYGWHISRFVKYKKRLPLSVFGMEYPPQTWSYCYL